ncbi:MAG: alkaline phosphatase family protein [Bythopirellula sp.]
MRTRWILIISCLCCLLPASLGLAQQRKVLIIGMDGMRPSDMLAANTPNIDALIANGAFSDQALNTWTPQNAWDGVSGTNWSSMLTGVQPDRHQHVGNFDGTHLIDDDGTNPTPDSELPTLFGLLKQNDPSIETAAINSWSGIGMGANTTLEFSQTVVDHSLSGGSDAGTRDAAVDVLLGQGAYAGADPDVVFVHFSGPDSAGHGFGWESSQYDASMVTADGWVGDLVAAVNSRPNSASEDWLYLMSADHGGSNNQHGTNDVLTRTVPFLISGNTVPNGVDLGAPRIVDITATALGHMGIVAVGLDGSIVGITGPGSPNGIVGDVNQSGEVAGDGSGLWAEDDVTAFVEGWMTTGHSGVFESYTHGDMNFDGVTNIADWAILNAELPDMGAAIMRALSENVVPEPSSGVMITAALAFAFYFRRMPCRHL